MFPIFEGTNSLEYTSIYNFAGINFHESQKKLSNIFSNEMNFRMVW